MICRVVSEMTRDVPVEWDRELARISPRDTGLSWLEFRWVFTIGKVKGVWVDRSRWVLFEMQPERFIGAERWRLLNDAPPRAFPASLQPGRRAVITDWQYDYFHRHRVYPWAFWVIQGRSGGNPAVYSLRESMALRLGGEPDDPPPVGAHCYADFDDRVVQQIVAHDRLLRANHLVDTLVETNRLRHQFDRSTRDAEETFRANYLAWFRGQLEPSTDFLTWFTKQTKADRIFRKARPAEIRAAQALDEQFITTGRVPFRGVA